MTIQTKFYENQLGFVGDVIKTFWCFFRFTFPTAIHLALKMRPISFTRQCRDIIRVRGEKFTLLHGKLTQDNMYQSLSESARFCGRYDKNILVRFFRFTM